MSTEICQPCGKHFTGPVCYEQHLKSDKHKKKLLLLGLKENSGATTSGCSDSLPQPVCEVSRSIIKCSICDDTFSALKNYQVHCLSPEHARKVLEKESADSLMSNNVSSSGIPLNSDGCSANIVESEIESDRILPVTEMYKYQALSFSFCDVCVKHFSGPEPYKQHIESALHKKKVEAGKNSTGHSNNIFGDYACSPCSKVFSGQVPYDQHMNSDLHKKKVQYFSKSVSEIDSTSMFEKSTVPNSFIDENHKGRWFCDICEVPCSGPAPYAQHLEGNAHKKKEARIEWQKKLLKPHNFTLEPASPLAIEEKSNENAPEFINGCTDFQKPDNSNLNSENTFVLPELRGNLNAMSSEELEDSIKIFLPDDSIDFDKADDKNNAILIDKNSDVKMCN